MTIRYSIRKISPTVWACLLLIGISTSWLLAWIAARSLNVSSPLDHADALVVLGGSAVYVERTRLAAALFHQRRAPVVILTDDHHQGGWSPSEQRNPYFVELAAQELRKSGVPSDKIVVLHAPVASTYDEGVLLRQHAQANHSRSLLFVTSSYHSRRALWVLQRIFAGTGIQVGLEPVPPGQQSSKPSSWWLSRRGWREVALEYPKMIYYWFRYS